MNHEIASNFTPEQVSAIRAAASKLRVASQELGFARAQICKHIMGFQNDNSLFALMRSMIGNEPVGAACTEDFIGAYIIGAQVLAEKEVAHEKLNALPELVRGVFDGWKGRQPEARQ